MLYSLSFDLTRGNSTMRYIKLELRFSLCRKTSFNLKNANKRKLNRKYSFALQMIPFLQNKPSYPSITTLYIYWCFLDSTAESACATRIELNKLTSLIISISLKVSRSSQSTFTMWPCRWAFVSWMQRWEGRQRNEHIILAKSREKYRNGRSVELITAWWLVCKQPDRSCTVPAANPASPHTQQPVHSSVSECGCWECKHTLGHEQEAHNSAA